MPRTGRRDPLKEGHSLTRSDTLSKWYTGVKRPMRCPALPLDKHLFSRTINTWRRNRGKEGARDKVLTGEQRILMGMIRHDDERSESERSLRITQAWTWSSRREMGAAINRGTPTLDLIAGSALPRSNLV